LPKIVKLGYAIDTQETFKVLFHLGKKPSRVRIVCPIVKNVELEEFSFLKTIIRLLGTGTVVTIVTRDFMESKREAVKQIEHLRNDLVKGKISKDLYTYRSEKLTKKISSIETSEKMFEQLKASKASIYCQRRIHAKIIVVETREETLALIMSSNLTLSGLSKNIEIGVLLNDSTSTNEISRYVESIINYSGTRPL
jgi:phosphatidylserine/phosphatidylglycerophosphate/cardiolipin synthase-like enzyme